MSETREANERAGTPDRFAEIEQAYLNDTVQALQHQLKAANERAERLERFIKEGSDDDPENPAVVREYAHLYEKWKAATERAEAAEAKLAEQGGAK